MVDIGLLGLRLDDRRRYRLHVWGPGSRSTSPVHDHPYDFTSTVVIGELTNTRYIEDAEGIEYRRVRYSPPDEDARTTDSVTLSGIATVLRAGDDTHNSRPSCTTAARCRARSPSSRCRSTTPLTVCTPGDAPWVSGQARPARRTR